ncbi:MAG TPA: type I restriction-modification system subunit M N-terminal domain-containing protein, partial [Allocoleopsis sp.]
MITGELKSKVDKLWDKFWSSGISNPLLVIEQISYLLFIKRLDDLQIAKEKKSQRFKKPVEKPIFTEDQSEYRWGEFKKLPPEQMLETVQNKVFPFIKNMGITGGTYTKHMKDATFLINNAALLSSVVEQIAEIPIENRDTKGDLYEYMLSKIAIAGQNGQFRTPRQIIKMMVEL